MDQKMDFYSLHNILSYGAPVNIIITERGKRQILHRKGLCNK